MQVPELIGGASGLGWVALVEVDLLRVRRIRPACRGVVLHLLEHHRLRAVLADHGDPARLA
jgi:hypothetical protein